jgi:putative copper export protein
VRALPTTAAGWQARFVPASCQRTARDCHDNSIPMLHYALLLQGPEEKVSAGKIALEYIGFLSFFFVFGALGFHFQVLKSLRSGSAGTGRDIAAVADRRAAVIGLTGSLLMVVTLVAGLLARAADKHMAVLDVVRAGGGRQLFQIGCIALLLIGYTLAAGRMRAGWLLAGAVGIVYALRNITTGKWFSVVNPLHEVAASLWLGTLLVMVIAGLGTVLRGPAAGNERGRMVAVMVSRFSPLALSAAALLGITGVTTAWRHLKHLNSLWTTPYGYALDAKLCVVAIVVALGAWNWRRMAPQLGNEESALNIRRSATTELSFAAVVLAITSLLVSLPSPAGGGPPGAGGRPGVEGRPGAGPPADTARAPVKIPRR